MVVYVDILLFINMIINFAVLETAEKLLKRNCRLYRMLSGAAIGALFSLLIFYSAENRLLLLLLKLLSSAVVTLIVFGWRSAAEYGKALVCNTVISLLYCGAYILFYQLFKPPNMVIVNDVLYLQTNPILLLSLTAVIYLILLAVYRLLSERIKNSVVALKLIINGQSYQCIGKIDTGCSLKEPFSSSPVIITDTSVFTVDSDKPHRIIPYSTVNSHSFLSAVKADSVYINKKQIQKAVYVASAKIQNHSYQAIINSEIIR